MRECCSGIRDHLAQDIGVKPASEAEGWARANLLPLTSAQNYTCRATAPRTAGLAKSAAKGLLPGLGIRVVPLEGTLGDFLVQTPAQLRVKSHPFVPDVAQGSLQTCKSDPVPLQGWACPRREAFHVSFWTCRRFLSVRSSSLCTSL